jgi:uncharacterized protein YndB with AHSA1/START domain
LHSGISAAGGTAVLLLVLLLAVLAAVTAGLVILRRLEVSRSVVVHASRDEVWEFVRHLPSLHDRHGKARELCDITGWTLRHGDGEGAGSVWRAKGSWNGADYWADLEIVKVDPGRQLAFTLRRDSLGTHRALRKHLGTLLLEETGSGTTKITWRLRADLRMPRLLLARLSSRSRLQARLFDQGLRSLKVEIDNSVPDEPRAGRPADTSPTADAPAPPPARTPPSRRSPML